ncbi:tumor necrosis factor receptor superfamily member 6B isoform X2 [Astyanax mexicanus]|uniref:tumor necrosis factor receptor superfamily member 6B isoform X2 n=1 Tax=Astyanax mexicanus TaxID=7994 RepID=UPI0020CB659F|nr:tumor necrosis factor receptor superfamily member 6B isoform X2 [Astyanax mexicanus]
MTRAWNLFIFVLSVLICISSQEERTYQRTLPSGAKVVCDFCPPGDYQRSPCTLTRPTECRQCRDGFYTEFWNYVPECLPCDPCEVNQEEIRPCTRFHNRVCQCKPGYFWHSHYCKKHTVCSLGEGVKTEGTPSKDTVCEPCANGHYAAGPEGNKRCTPYTACKGQEKPVISGTNWHDNICVTCDNFTTQGWPTLIKPLLSELFAHQNGKRQIHRLRRFVQSENMTSEHTVQDWLNQASEEQLKNLPEKLERVNLQHLSLKVDHKIKRFIQEAKYCDNSIM